MVNRKNGKNGARPLKSMRLNVPTAGTVPDGANVSQHIAGAISKTLEALSDLGQSSERLSIGIYMTEKAQAQLETLANSFFAGNKTAAMSAALLLDYALSNRESDQVVNPVSGSLVAED